jgi:hypothetical protein
MRVSDSGSQLVVDDQSISDRWIGGFNFAIAGACAVIAIVHYHPNGDLRDLFLLLIAPFAAAVALISLWRLFARPGTVLLVDGSSGMVTLVRRTALRRMVYRWASREVAGFTRSQRPGQDGVPVYRLRLDLADGASFAAATLWQADRTLIDDVVARANALLGK